MGHLATFTAADKYAFVLSQGDPLFRWLGGYQLANQATPDVGWRWVTGEPWSYTNWHSGEPNDGGGEPEFGGPEANYENALAGWYNGGWNDWDYGIPGSGYVVEYDTTQDIPEPATGIAFLVGLAGLAVARRKRRS